MSGQMMGQIMEKLRKGKLDAFKIMKKKTQKGKLDALDHENAQKMFVMGQIFGKA